MKFAVYNGAIINLAGLGAGTTATANLISINLEPLSNPVIIRKIEVNTDLIYSDGIKFVVYGALTRIGNTPVSQNQIPIPIDSIGSGSLGAINYFGLPTLTESDQYKMINCCLPLSPNEFFWSLFLQLRYYSNVGGSTIFNNSTDRTFIRLWYD